MLDHAFAQRNLSISRHDDAAIATHTQNCSGTNQTILGHERRILIIAAKMCDLRGFRQSCGRNQSTYLSNRAGDNPVKRLPPLADSECVGIPDPLIFRDHSFPSKMKPSCPFRRMLALLIALPAIGLLT